MWNRMLARVRTGSRLISKAVRSYGEDRVGRMAAAVAYRAMFALAPLLILAVAGFGLVVGSSDRAREDLFELIESVGGPQVAEAVDVLTLSAVETGDIVAVIGFLLFAWTGSSLFIEIQNDLNDIFKVPQERTSGLGAAVRKRLVGVAWAVGLGLTVVPIWVANLGGEWFESLIPLEYDLAHRILGWGTRLLSAGALTILFAVALKTMTRATIRWRAVLVGGVFTTTAFLLAAFGAGLYFAWDRGPSAPQIAGAFFVILLLASTLASVFLFGAQVTRVYNDHLSLIDRGW